MTTPGISFRWSGDGPADPPPRHSPPLPAVSRLEGFLATARLGGLEVMPWQKIAAQTILGVVGDRWAFPSAAVVVARQNGKTTLIQPRVVMGLLRGERIAHAAQAREVPRASFLQIAALFESVPQLRRTLAGDPRLSNGQEEIRTVMGGRYRIAASTTAAMRGWANDLVIVDEVREQRDTDFLAAALPTLTASADPQILFFSNAGDAESVVLNDLRRRGLEGSDPGLAYLEWSADPDRPDDDRAGWVEANPALGHTITAETLERHFRSLPREKWATEHLCRWVQSMKPRLIPQIVWERCAADLEPIDRPAVGIAVDPGGRRVSAVGSWIQTDGTVALTQLGEWVGDPVDLETVAAALIDFSRGTRISGIGFDPWTDSDLSRKLSALGKLSALTGRDWSSASQGFVRLAESGRLRHSRASDVGSDMPWVERRTKGDGTYVAARGDRPVTAALAAIRASWIASGPQPAKPQIR